MPGRMTSGRRGSGGGDAAGNAAKRAKAAPKSPVKATYKPGAKATYPKGATPYASSKGVPGKSTGSTYVAGAPTSGGFKHGPVKPSPIPKGPQVKTMSHQKKGR